MLLILIWRIAGIELFFYYTHSISAKYIYTGSVVVMCILKTM